MKNAIIRSLTVAFAAAAALAACNGTNYSNVYVGPTPGPPCVLPSTFTAIYPPNNSTVPASVTAVYVASQQSNLATGNLGTAVQPPNGLPAYQGGAFAKVTASQIPSPHATPGFSNPIYYASSIGGLVAGATYQIGFNNTSSGCQATLFLTFTTR